MSKPEKMPTPWRHPKYGTYYLRKRVPTDIKHLWQGTDPVQRSLDTKNKSEADLRICDKWRKLHDEFSELRRLAARQVGLCEEIIPDLLDEWFHDNLKEDEIWRFDGTIAKTDEDIRDTLETSDLAVYANAYSTAICIMKAGRNRADVRSILLPSFENRIDPHKYGVGLSGF